MPSPSRFAADKTRKEIRREDRATNAVIADEDAIAEIAREIHQKEKATNGFARSESSPSSIMQTHRPRSYAAAADGIFGRRGVQYKIESKPISDWHFEDINDKKADERGGILRFVVVAANEAGVSKPSNVMEINLARAAAAAADGSEDSSQMMTQGLTHNQGILLRSASVSFSNGSCGIFWEIATETTKNSRRREDGNSVLKKKKKKMEEDVRVLFAVWCQSFSSSSIPCTVNEPTLSHIMY